MSWYNTVGAYAPHILFSKVRYIRNISKQAFYPLIDPKKGSESFSRIETILQKNGFHAEKLPVGVTPSILSLAEKHFIERDIVFSDKPRALYLNEPCSLLVALGGDNYISISSIVPGLAFDEAKNIASGAEELIDREMDLAYLDGVGYLSPEIKDCGSGMYLSAALYLPSMNLFRTNEHFQSMPHGMSLSPMFSGNASGDLYILSFIPHYLSDTDASLSLFRSTALHFAEKEKKLLSTLKKDQEEFEDKALRALGILLSSKRLGEHEMLSLISDIRLYICIADAPHPSLPDLSVLNYLSAEGLNASVISSAKVKCETLADCDRARAVYVSSYIKHKNEVNIQNGK